MFANAMQEQFLDVIPVLIASSFFIGAILGLAIGANLNRKSK